MIDSKFERQLNVLHTTNSPFLSLPAYRESKNWLVLNLDLKKKKAHSLTKHSKLYKDIQIYRHCFFMKQRSSGTGDSCHNKITQLSKALMLEIGYQSLSYERHDGEGRGNMANNLNEQ